MPACCFKWGGFILLQERYFLFKKTEGICNNECSAGHPHSRFAIWLSHCRWQRGKPYFYYYGTFYEQSGNSDYYETVTAPEEAIIDAIPDGYEIRKIEKEEYYFLGGTYYAQVPAPALKDKIGYEVVTIIEAY